jgi:hypothetical protein
MNRIIANIFKNLALLLVTFMMLLSGSSLFVIRSVINDEHECCCCGGSDEDSQAEESLKCDMNCCTVTDAKSQDLQASLPVTFHARDKAPFQIINFDELEKGDNVRFTISDNPSLENQQGLYILTSVFRI